MFVVGDVKDRCHFLRFTIFDYVGKRYIYNSTFEKMKFLNEFETQILIDLARPSLDLVEFERSPFRLHILCLQSIINAYRVKNKP